MAVTGFGLIYTLGRQLPDDANPWSKNLLKTLAVLDGFMGAGGCTYERAPVLPDMFEDILARGDGS